MKSINKTVVIEEFESGWCTFDDSWVTKNDILFRLSDSTFWKVYKFKQNGDKNEEAYEHRERIKKECPGIIGLDVDDKRSCGFLIPWITTTSVEYPNIADRFIVNNCVKY